MNCDFPRLKHNLSHTFIILFKILAVIYIGVFGVFNQSRVMCSDTEFSRRKLAGKPHISLIIELNRQLYLHFVTW